MLVVISDLHFQDTMNDVIRDAKNKVLVSIDRNVSPEAFRQFFKEVKSIAEGNKAQELLIALAGDIFDLNRSQKWFAKNNDEIRPYGESPPEQWGPIACEILDDIVASNKDTFDIIKAETNSVLKNGQRVCFKYIPGNHDRIVNQYQPLREKVCGLLGLTNSDTPFKHEIAEDNYGVHIRHGHEYDPSNFAGKVPENGPFIVNANDYNSAPLGDYATIDFAARLAFEYRTQYKNEIQSAPDADFHRFIYRKLLEFDNLRPQSKLRAFLESEIPHRDKAMEYLAPVLKDVLQRALENKFVRSQLGSLKISLAKIVKFISTQLLFDFLIKSEGSEPCRQAQREPALQNLKYRYVVSGHTHNPNLEFIGTRQEDQKELFFFDTGTWRKQIRKCLYDQTFASAKALTYLVFYRSDEDPPRGGGHKEYSFDYWSGYTKKEI